MGSAGSGFGDRAVAGNANPTSVDVDVEFEDVDVVGRFVLGRAFEGAPGRAHGGMVAAVFDDVTGYIIGRLREPAFTGELTVRYEKPVPIETPLEMRSPPRRPRTPQAVHHRRVPRPATWSSPRARPSTSRSIPPGSPARPTRGSRSFSPPPATSGSPPRPGGARRRRPTRSSFVKIARTCDSTVLGLMNSPAAIAAFDLPCAIKRQHVALAGRQPAERRRRRPRRASSCSPTSGSTTRPPAATVRHASRNSSRSPTRSFNR